MRLLHVLSFAALIFSGCSSTGEQDSGASEGDTTGPAADAFPEEAAGRICASLFACGCAEPGFADETACLPEMVNALEFDQADAVDKGLVYDPECGEEVLAAWDVRGCAISLPALPETCAHPCRLYPGTKEIGEPCDEVSGQWHDCRQGLVCETDATSGVRQCADPCGAGLPEGDECIDAMFEPLGTCGLNLYCDSESRLCAMYPNAGDPCGGGMTCKAGAFCDATGASPVCAVKRGEDEPCSYPDWCRDGLYCEPSTDVCTPLPSTGLPCALGGQCDAFSMCVSGTCEAGVAIACVGEDALGG